MRTLDRLGFDYAGRDPYATEVVSRSSRCDCAGCISSRFWGNTPDPVFEVTGGDLPLPLRAVYLLLEQRHDMWPED